MLTFGPEQRLALAVIARAIQDLSSSEFPTRSAQKLVRRPPEGQAVTFDEGEGPKGPRAENVTLA